MNWQNTPTLSQSDQNRCFVVDVLFTNHCIERETLSIKTVAETHVSREEDFYNI